MSYTDKTSAFLYNFKIKATDLKPMAVNAKLFYDALNSPSFSAYMASDQLINNTGTQNVLNFDTKEWDLSTAFNTTTHRFTPLVAGYYIIICGVSVQVNHGGLNAATKHYLSIGLNGIISEGVKVIHIPSSGNDETWSYNTMAIVSLDGVSDYIDARVLNSTATKTLKGGQTLSYLQGFKLPTIF